MDSACGGGAHAAGAGGHDTLQGGRRCLRTRRHAPLLPLPPCMVVVRRVCSRKKQRPPLPLAPAARHVRAAHPVAPTCSNLAIASSIISYASLPWRKWASSSSAPPHLVSAWQAGGMAGDERGWLQRARAHGGQQWMPHGHSTRHSCLAACSCCQRPAAAQPRGGGAADAARAQPADAPLKRRRRRRQGTHHGVLVVRLILPLRLLPRLLKEHEPASRAAGRGALVLAAIGGWAAPLARLCCQHPPRTSRCPHGPESPWLLLLTAPQGGVTNTGAPSLLGGCLRLRRCRILQREGAGVWVWSRGLTH